MMQEDVVCVAEQLQVWRNAAETYSQHFPGHNYFTDLLTVQHSLGLAVTDNTAAAFASLVSTM